MEWYHVVVLICIFITINAEHFLFAIYHPNLFFAKVFVQMSCASSFCVLDMNPLFGMRPANIFSLVLVCFSIFLTVFFEEKIFDIDEV